MKYFLSALLVVLTLDSHTSAFSHSGGLDRSGCHNVTATGGRHCHRESSGSSSGGSSGGSSWGDAEDLLAILTVVSLITYIAVQSDKNGFIDTYTERLDPTGGFYFNYRPRSELKETHFDNFAADQNEDNGDSVTFGYRLRF